MEVKTENSLGNSTFSDLMMIPMASSTRSETSFALSSIFDLASSDVGGELFKSGGGGSFGFMDLLGLQDFGRTTTSLFDMFQTSQPAPPFPPQLPSPSPTLPESTSEVLNAPATPNSSTISSSSTELATNDHEQKNNNDKAVEVDQEDLDPDKSNKQ